MLIKKIILDNFRVYRGINEVVFEYNPVRNVYIISGYNGYGKTTFLTSLVWCLYGGQMQDVDDTFKRRIRESGGYPKYLDGCINRSALVDLDISYSVSIVFSDIEIPGIIANEVLLRRSFTIGDRNDQLDIYIDGQRNELVKDVGYDIFVQDFILPKEIAKFFFFDAEKITSLADNQSLDDKRQLGRAYSEVLGIKKYVDLLYNLVDLRLKYRKESAFQFDLERIKSLEEEVLSIELKLDHIKIDNEQLVSKNEIVQERLRAAQTKLWRIGSTLKLEDLEKLRSKREELINKGDELKVHLKSLLDLAPFAIAGNLFFKALRQAKDEYDHKANSLVSALKIEAITSQLDLILKSFPANIAKYDLIANLTPIIEELKSLQPVAGIHVSERFNLTKATYQEFSMLSKQLKTTYQNEFKRFTQELRRNRYEVNELSSKINRASSKSDDILMKEYQVKETSLLNESSKISHDREQLLRNEAVLQHELAIKKKVLVEFQNKINLKDDLREKDEIAVRLTKELQEFIIKIQKEKKHSLESAICEGLNRLMHKKNFVKYVSISIDGEVIEIELVNESGEKINKEDLSMGEKQLYATAIFQALVKESKVEFPVFIDSPMQKLDRVHAENILLDFYPNVSKQVVILPLLNKEMSIAEYRIIESHVNGSYIIEHNPEVHSSRFVSVTPAELRTFMANYNNIDQHA